MPTFCKNLLVLALCCWFVSCAQKTESTKPTPTQPETPQTQPTEPISEPAEPVIPEEPPEPVVEPEPTEEPPKPVAKPHPKPPAPKPKPEPKPEPVQPDTPAPVEKPTAPEPSTALTINGRISLDTSKIKDKDANIASTVVYFRPKDQNMVVTPSNDFVVSTQNKRFQPDVLAIPMGSQVTFPNRDKILHNVFSVSGAAQFDLGLYSPGEERTVTFEKPGVVFVHCNVHHSMQADVLVLDTPWYINVSSDGRFSLDDIPDQPGTLHIWHPRAQLITQEIAKISDVKQLDITVPITRQKVPKHLNKFGKSYRPTRK